MREAIRNYIKATGRPVSLQELREEFVGRRGISKSNVSPFFFAGNGVVKVGEDLYAWEDGLRGARPDVGAVEGALDDYCSTAMEKARLFYDVDQLVSSDALPDMGAMRWNKDLLSVALSESEKYRILGPAKNALVSIDLHPEVVTDEDFFGTLLSNEYYGLTTWNDFASRMERLGIATNLRPEYFASMPSIEANNAIIKLNR